jgi:hypothetical protein
MESFFDSMVPIFGIIGVFGMPAVIVWTALHFNNKKKEQFHTSLQKLIASGQELTPELMQSIPGYQAEESKDSDVKGGAVLIGTGIGIVLLGYFGMHNSVIWGSGLLVACLGVGLLSAGIYSKRDSSEDV